MIESIEELKEICHPEESKKEWIWISKVLYRRFSIYITKLLLRTNITANNITALNIGLTLMASFLFSFGDYLYSVMGGSLLFVLEILDLVDGEIARYRMYKKTRSNSAKMLGTTLERIVHAIFFLVFGGISLGYRQDDGGSIIFLCMIALAFTLHYATQYSLPFHKRHDPINLRLSRNPEGIIAKSVYNVYKSSFLREFLRNLFNPEVMVQFIFIASILNRLPLILYIYGITLLPSLVLFIYLRIKTLE